MNLFATAESHNVTVLEDINLRFSGTNPRIGVITDATGDKTGIIKQDLLRYCPVSKMIEQADTKIEIGCVFFRP